MLGFPMAHTLSVVSRVRLKTFSMFGTLHGVCQWKEDLVSIFHFLFSFFSADFFFGPVLQRVLYTSQTKIRTVRMLLDGPVLQRVLYTS